MSLSKEMQNGALSSLAKRAAVGLFLFARSMILEANIICNGSIRKKLIHLNLETR